MDRLEQKKLIETRVFKLHDDRVEVKTKNRDTESTVFFKYEEINQNKYFVNQKSQPNYSMYVICRNLAIILLLCNVFGVLEDWRYFYIFLCSGCVFFVIHAFSVTRLTGLDVDGDHELIFYSNIPDTETVDEFIETLYEKRNAYLKQTYFAGCNQDTENFDAILDWLLEINVITRQEYDARIQFIKARS